jgi:methyl-accepting chemotaxis protein
MDAFAENLQHGVIGIMKQIAAGEKVASVPILDEHDEIGPALKETVTTLNDLIEETMALASQAAAGNISVRGNADRFKGGYRDIITGINNTLENIIEPLHETMNLAHAYAKGDFSSRFSEDVVVNGDFVPFKESMNKIGEEIGRAIGR